MDYEQDFEVNCPKCWHSPLHHRMCSEIMCEGGYIDESDEDYLVEGSNMVKCDECEGTGVEWCCPKCGENLSGQMSSEDEEDYFLGDSGS